MSYRSVDVSKPLDGRSPGPTLPPLSPVVNRSSLAQSTPRAHTLGRLALRHRFLERYHQSNTAALPYFGPCLCPGQALYLASLARPVTAVALLRKVDISGDVIELLSLCTLLWGHVRSLTRLTAIFCVKCAICIGRLSSIMRPEA